MLIEAKIVSELVQEGFANLIAILPLIATRLIQDIDKKHKDFNWKGVVSLMRDIIPDKKSKEIGLQSVAHESRTWDFHENNRYRAGFFAQLCGELGQKPPSFLPGDTKQGGPAERSYSHIGHLPGLTCPTNGLILQ
jgi:hypothetical protein